MITAPPLFGLQRPGAGYAATGLQPPGGGGQPSGRGFTLVELLVALALVGMILVILYSGLHLAIQTSEATERITRKAERLRVVENFLRGHLYEARLLFYSGPEQGQRITFRGQPHAMRFVAPLLEHLGLGGLYWITIEWVREGKKGRLMVRWTPYRPNQPLGQETANKRSAQKPELLLDKVEKAEFSYFGVRSAGAEPAWHDHWESARKPPQLISLKIRTEAGGWPEFLIGLRTTPVVNGLGIGNRFGVDFGPHR